MIPQADGHSSNETMGLSAEMEEDNCNLIEPIGHSPHATQQLDQTGGPIFHAKSVLKDLVQHAYRTSPGGLSRKVIMRCVEIAVVLSHTPAVCAFATDRVGWDEDEDGGLVYAPMSRDHIVNQLVNIDAPDQQHEHQYEHLGMVAPGTLAAAKQAAQDMFSDGNNTWTEDADDASALPPEQSRSRRAGNTGAIVASQSDVA